jgi:hypothetical protein
MVKVYERDAKLVVSQQETTDPLNHSKIIAVA